MCFLNTSTVFYVLNNYSYCHCDSCFLWNNKNQKVHIGSMIQLISWKSLQISDYRRSFVSRTSPSIRVTTPSCIAKTGVPTSCHNTGFVLEWDVAKRWLRSRFYFDVYRLWSCEFFRMALLAFHLSYSTLRFFKAIALPPSAQMAFFHCKLVAGQSKSKA